MAISHGHAQTNSANYLRQGIKEYQEKNFSEAIGFFTLAMENGPQQKALYPLLSSAYLANDQPQKARTTAANGLKKFPEYTDLQWILAEAYLQGKNYPKALQNYQDIKRAYHLDPTALPKNVSAAQLNDRIGRIYDFLGGQAAKDHDFKGAIPYYDKAQHYLPDIPHTYSNLAFAYLQTGQMARSLEVVKAGLRKFPKNKKLLQLQASILYHNKDYIGLEKVYYKLYQQDKDNTDLGLVYAELMLTNGKQKAAFALYGELLKEHPAARNIYASLIKFHESQLNYKAKIKVLKSMLPHFEDKRDVYKDIAETYEVLKDWEAARKYYDTLQLHDANKPRASLAIARTYQKEGKWEKAESEYELVLKTWPGNKPALVGLGKLYEKKEHWKKALGIYQTLAALQADNYVHARLGWVYQQLNDRKNALQYYRKAIKNRAMASYVYLETARMTLQSHPDSAFVLSKKALVIGLEQLASAQKKLIGAIKHDNSSDTPMGNEEKLARTDRLDSLATRSFTFFIDNFSMEATEPELLKLAEQYQGSAKLYYLIGRFYKDHKQTDKAFDFLLKCLQHNANIKEAHLLLGELYEEAGNEHQAILAYERSLTLNPEDALVYSSLIRLYRKQHQLNLLCDKWLAWYQGNPDNTILKSHLIEALHKAGEFEQAKRISHNEI